MNSFFPKNSCNLRNYDKFRGVICDKEKKYTDTWTHHYCSVNSTEIGLIFNYLHKYMGIIFACFKLYFVCNERWSHFHSFLSSIMWSVQICIWCNYNIIYIWYHRRHNNNNFFKFIILCWTSSNSLRYEEFYMKFSCHRSIHLKSYKFTTKIWP